MPVHARAHDSAAICVCDTIVCTYVYIRVTRVLVFAHMYTSCPKQFVQEVLLLERYTTRAYQDANRSHRLDPEIAGIASAVNRFHEQRRGRYDRIRLAEG